MFGWARPPGGCTLDYAETSIVVQASGRNVATLRATVPDPQDQARWITDFHVQDTGRAVEAAIAAGGQPSPLLPECGTGTEVLPAASGTPAGPCSPSPTHSGAPSRALRATTKYGACRCVG
ncbi:hypothetical protein [Streptomyces sp. WZ.A104]|uniref:hypothetical protein n=1 Tax=Streptomyces sp. WZ.A104 TaxID=2023771 RepID=UPI00359C295F